ncbi:hypothetical protein TNCV_4433621 [Trichonephila clavipes]|nr:hypothetical protein TNCV_4433621 [Trichonephila clavipes]
MEIGTGSSDNGSLRDESSGFDTVQRRSNESQDGKKKGQRKKSRREETVTPTTKRLQPQTTKWKKSGVPTNHREEDTTGRTSSDPETAEEETTAPYIEKSEEDQTARMPDEKVINNGRTRKEKGAFTRKSLSLEVLVGNAQLQVMRTRLYRFFLHSFKQVVGRIIAMKQVTVSGHCNECVFLEEKNKLLSCKFLYKYGEKKLVKMHLFTSVYDFAKMRQFLWLFALNCLF